MSGRGHRRKGDRIERRLVAQHLGIGAKHTPLSDTSHFRGGGDQIEMYLLGHHRPPVKAGVMKGRKSGAVFTTLEDWMTDCDALFLRKGGSDPMVVIPWRVWEQVVDQARRLHFISDFAR